MNEKKIILILLLLFAVYPSIGQVQFLHPQSHEISVETHTYILKEGKKLELDIYIPTDDTVSNRPLVLYMHGGGFQEGQRDSKSIVKFCNRLAGYGYVVASMSYRLTRKNQPGAFGCDCPAVEKQKTFAAAVDDIQDATSFLIENQESFDIDPHKIILAGSSAGAEAVLIAAYEPPVIYDSEPIAYAGVIGMAGAIPDTSKINKISAVPSLFFHGTDDNLVPYATAPHHYCAEDRPGYLVLHGSHTLAKKLHELDVPYWLHTTCGAGHEMASRPMTAYFHEIVDFCYNFVLNKNGEFRHTIVKGKEQNSDYKHFNFCQ